MDGSGNNSLPPLDSLSEAAQTALGQSASTSLPSSSSPAQLSSQQAPAPTEPREVGTLKEELIDRPLTDIQNELGKFLSLSEFLGIENPSDTPEEKAKKQQMLQNFNQLSQEDQAAAQQIYQERMALQQQKDEEMAARNQREQEARESSIAPPSGPQHGAPDQSGQSKSQMAMQKLKDDRTKSGTLQSAN